jgi:hypothetical protein
MGSRLDKPKDRRRPFEKPQHWWQKTKSWLHSIVSRSVDFLEKRPNQ